MGNAFDIRPYIMALINVACIFILHTLNDFLSEWGVYIFVPVLLVLVPSVYLKLWQLVLVAVFSGAISEAFLPVPAFSLVFMYVAASVFIKSQSFRFRSIDKLGVFSVCAVVNTAMFAWAVLFFMPHSVSWTTYAVRVFSDYLFSTLFLLWTSSYWYSFHKSLFMALKMELSLDLHG